MEWNPDTLHFLSQCFLNTLSPDHDPRRRAEAALSEAADRPIYALAVLRLIAGPSVHNQIRQSATINFKDHLKAHWATKPNDPEQIESLILTLMVNSSPKIQAQLTEALNLIWKHDFPKAWPTLLPELVATWTNELLLDLKYCLDNFAKPLEVFKRTAGFIDQAVGSGTVDVKVLKSYIESQRLCCRIFYSLNIMELPEFFEDHMDEWMIEFNKYLAVKYSAPEDSGNDGLALVDELELLFVRILADIWRKRRRPVWGLLVVVSNSSNRERLTVTAIKFLTTSIVIPNVMSRDEDEELFEIYYVEFIRRDMEGSDLDTRRRIACELLKGIAMNYKEKVTEKVSAQIQSLLTSFGGNPVMNWKHKDYAIYLVVALAMKKAGGSSVSTDLVDVESFFGSVIVPKLQNQTWMDFQCESWRIEISKPTAMALLPDAVHFLGSESNVVHSYAASCIEKLLLVKDEGGRARYTAADVSPFLLALVTSLFTALQKPESEENQYVMKCIMWVLGVANVSHEVAIPCINGLAAVLNSVYENPKNPVFNHYMSEAVALLIKRAFEQDQSLISSFETSLLPSLQMILSRDVSEFFPYAFQLLAQLVDLNGSPIPGNYMETFAILPLPESWKKSGNVPALYYEQGFYVLNTLIENLGYDVISSYISHIWHGPEKLATTMNAVQPDVFCTILEQFWVLNVRLITGSTELKLTSVATTRLICESLSPSDSKLWGKILDSVVTIVSCPENRVEEDHEVPDFGATVGYMPHSSIYTMLGGKKRTPCGISAIQSNFRLHLWQTFLPAHLEYTRKSLMKILDQQIKLHYFNFAAPIIVSPKEWRTLASDQMVMKRVSGVIGGLKL
ncbi:UNVERIFIED_CONTAM: Exportin-2 [Sesamum indicum]